MIIDTLKLFFNKFCYSLSGNLFAWVMTLRASITNSDAIFKYSKKSQDYTVSSKKSSEDRVLKFRKLPFSPFLSCTYIVIKAKAK